MGAFGAAYPYRNCVQVIEAYGERVFRPNRGVVALHTGRQTIGARIRLPAGPAAHINVLHSTGQLEEEENRPTALDVGFTCSFRRY